MAYVAPYIDAAGLHIPTYDDILDELISQAQSIFGSDIYLDADSQDYQFISIISLKIYDTMLAVQLAYNNRSPLTAIGAGLDSIVKLNGIARVPASYSTCQVTLTGTALTEITNGVIQDTAGYKWDLPASVTIGSGGTVTVTATCETIGAITALAGTLTQIMTPTAGWTSVTNAAAATPGLPAEADSQLRARQALSVAGPSTSLLEGTIAAIASVSGVVRYRVYENPTANTDSNNIPSHSLAPVVEGGADEDIAQAIFDNRGVGCGMYGTTTVAIEDDYGNSVDIKFSRPTSVDIYVDLTVNSFDGYSSATGDAIKEAVADYLNSLDIGQTVSVLSGIVNAANSVNTNPAKPLFSVTAALAGKTENPEGSTDITMDFDEVSYGDVDNITVTAS